mgnify:CR=1 FL=1
MDQKIASLARGFILNNVARRLVSLYTKVGRKWQEGLVDFRDDKSLLQNSYVS